MFNVKIEINTDAMAYTIRWDAHIINVHSKADT